MNNSVSLRFLVWNTMFVLVVMCVPCHVFAEVHVFALPDGRAIEAKIVGYDAKGGRVTLERKDGKQVKVSPSGFVSADQKYIKEWIAAHAFLDDRILRVECDDHLVKRWKEEETTDLNYTDGEVIKDFIHNVIKYEDIAFEFTFRNLGKQPIKGLTLEYCIYYEQSHMTEHDAEPEVQAMTLYGTMGVPDIAVKKAISLTTQSARIYVDQINPIERLDGDRRQQGKGEVIGICARLVYESDGEKTVREIRKPGSLSEKEYPWTTKTTPNERPPSKT